MHHDRHSQLPDSVKHTLVRMNQELTCPICMYLFTDCTYTPCGHAFCHACITRSVSVKARCPLCKVNVSKRALLPAGTVNAVVAEFRKLREKYEAKSGFILSQIPYQVYPMEPNDTEDTRTFSEPTPDTDINAPPSQPDTNQCSSDDCPLQPVLSTQDQVNSEPQPPDISIPDPPLQVSIDDATTQSCSSTIPRFTPASLPVATAQSDSTPSCSLSLRDDPPSRYIIHPANFLNETTRKCLDQMAENGILQLTNKSSSDVSHYVFPKDCTKENITTCYLFALVLRKPLVSEEWIIKSFAANGLVDVEPYKLTSIAGIQGGPQRSRTSFLRGEQPLFASTRVHAHTSIPETHRQELVQLLLAGGGKVITSEEKVTPGTIVLCHGKRSLGTRWHTLEQRLGCSPIHFGWLIESILAYQLKNPQDFSLCA
ncbi:hypothetical protein DM01DRAFT_1403060 [Hesseltinella vesiculosa]|uniref:RING-type E3 ubiquitin transferase BRCA1 n=1 Tax=Hesseltinella vesiculosa TaxID=101127 RepID=A0A1X2GWX9_9FUNG|nr:hypothetical protein DM01DRAFT_1403060 [Hesseltinella vesiculosa]